MTPDSSDPMPGKQNDYSPEYDEEKRRARQMDNHPTRVTYEEEADRIRRLNGGGGLGGCQNTHE